MCASLRWPAKKWIWCGIDRCILIRPSIFMRFAGSRNRSFWTVPIRRRSAQKSQKPMWMHYSRIPNTVFRCAAKRWAAGERTVISCTDRRCSLLVRVGVFGEMVLGPCLIYFRFALVSQSTMIPCRCESLPVQRLQLFSCWFWVGCFVAIHAMSEL